MSYTEPILDEGAGLILIENPDDFHSLRIEDRFHPREREKARERERERERESAVQFRWMSASPLQNGSPPLHYNALLAWISKD
jgi:hypothetical protein